MNEETIINYIAGIERSITGVVDSFNYAKNPDNLTRWPAVVHYIPSFQTPLMGHHNRWDETMKVSSILLVKPRQQQGGKLAYLENDAIPFAQKWRNKWQDHDVIANALSTMSARKAFLESGAYGVGTGNNLLTYSGVD